MVLSEALGEREAADEGCIEPAVATAWTDDGRELSAFVAAPPGTPLSPLADAELEAKFDACLAAQPAPVGEAQAARLRARIWNLEREPLGTGARARGASGGLRLLPDGATTSPLVLYRTGGRMSPDMACVEGFGGCLTAPRSCLRRACR